MWVWQDATQFHAKIGTFWLWGWLFNRLTIDKYHGMAWLPTVRMCISVFKPARSCFQDVPCWKLLAPSSSHVATFLFRKSCRNHVNCLFVHLLHYSKLGPVSRYTVYIHGIHFSPSLLRSALLTSALQRDQQRDFRPATIDGNSHHTYKKSHVIGLTDLHYR